MAKFKLEKNVAGAQSFRFQGQKYVTRKVDQKTLKMLHKAGCAFVLETKESKKVVSDDQSEQSESD